MAFKDSCACVVIVTIELGHQANFLKEPSPEGFTHDWTVFVRGYEGSKLEHFVEKVVFRLHKTFKTPIRKIHEPPYRVTESGYAGFLLPIEVHFKNKQTPRKISFEYDLFLNARETPPINNVRYEKLKFQNPTPEFKAKLIKAGGVEQSTEPVPQHIPDMLRSPPKTSQDVKKMKSHKDKTKKSKTSPVKLASPASSLSSLSPMSSEDEKKEVPSFKKEREPPPPVKKESSVKSESSGKEKSKHKSSSSSHKKKHSSDKEREKLHEKEKSSHSHQKDSSKKDRESSSHKSRESDSFKDRDESHSSGKSSSHSDKKISSSSSSGKEKLSSTKEKDNDTVIKDKHHSSQKVKNEKSSGKDKHKDHHKSMSSVEPIKKSKEDSSKDSNKDSNKEKIGKDKEKHKSSLKRPGSPLPDSESTKKAKKISSSFTSDVKPPKGHSSEKERNVSSISKEFKEVKEKESKPSTSSSSLSSSHSKAKHDKSKHLKKSKHKSHYSDQQRKGSEDCDVLHKPKHTKPEKTAKSEKSSKSNSSTKSDHLGLSADFQPTLLLSPLKNKSDSDDTSLAKPSNKTVKRSKSTSSLNSSSGLSSHHASDSEDLTTKEEKTKKIVTGLTDDSDSESGEDNEICSSPQKEMKSALSKNDMRGQPYSKNKTSVVPSKDEQKMDIKVKDHVSKSKYPEEEKKSKGHDGTKNDRKKVHEKEKKKECEPAVDTSLSKSLSDESVNHERDILAPNGLTIEELISINEKIEKAQDESNTNLLMKIIDVISETNEYDIDDSALFFDICSLDKNIVTQIQTVLRD